MNMKIGVCIGFLNLLNQNIVYFDSFGMEHIPKEINKFINSKELGSAVNNDIKNIIFRIQAYDSIMC